MSNLGYAVNFARYWAFDHIPDRPRVLRIEITNRCNLRCIICDRSAMTRATEAIDWDLFTKIAGEAVDWGIPQIGLNRFGEPMLHPRLPDMIAFVKDRGGKMCEFVTNGTLLDEKRGRAVLEAGVDRVAVSVDGFTKQTYEHIRAGASHEEAMANINRYIELKKKINPRSKLQLNYVVTNETAAEVRDFQKHWGTKVDHIYYIPFMGYAGLKSMSNLKKPKGRTKCYMLWYMMISNADGQAGVCCHGDPAGVLQIGDLSKISLQQAWTGPEVDRIRRIHFEKNFSSLPICAACDLTMPYSRWARHYLAAYKLAHFGGQ